MRRNRFLRARHGRGQKVAPIHGDVEPILPEERDKLAELALKIFEHPNAVEDLRKALNLFDPRH